MYTVGKRDIMERKKRMRKREGKGRKREGKGRSAGESNERGRYMFLHKVKSK
jgi:hypothetical protein